MVFIFNIYLSVFKAFTYLKWFILLVSMDLFDEIEESELKSFLDFLIGIAMQNHNKKGYSLIEILLVISIVSISLLGLYGLYQFIGNQISASNLATQTQDTTEKVKAAYVSQANYLDLTIQRAVDEGYFNNNFSYDQGRVFSKEAEVTLFPVTDKQGIEGGGFAIQFERLKNNRCLTLAQELSRQADQIKINGVDIPKNDISLAIQQCNRNESSTVQLTYWKTGASDALNLCQAPTGYRLNDKNCPSGQSGKIRQRQSAFCTSAYANVQWTPWETYEDTCTSCPGDEQKIEACPSGYYGQNYQSRSFNCSSGHWNEWVVVRSECTACPEDEYREAACPFQSNPSGYIMPQKRTFICQESQWSNWINLSAQCVAPGTSIR